NGAWIQAGSDTQSSPKSLSARLAAYTQLSPPMKQSLLEAREHVWKAYFNNEREYLEQALPQELIAIDPGNDKFSTRDSILRGAERFAQSGSKLVNIEFPETETQTYGSVVQVYSTYVLELQTPKGPSRESGH